MDAFERTTKQLAAKYKRHLQYFKRPHYFRYTKIALFVLAVAASISLIALPHKPLLYSTGPISKNHERFADDCEKCHVGAKPNLLANLAALGGVALGDAKDGAKRAIHASNSLAELDQACNECHKGFEFHQPQSVPLSLLPVSGLVTGAEVQECSTCHREHQGPARMSHPKSESCTDCHFNQGKLEKTLVTFKNNVTPVKAAPALGMIDDFRKDGVRRFVPPRPHPHQPVAFESFRVGHPAFGYEQEGLRDPAELSFNHAAHGLAQAEEPNRPPTPKIPLFKPPKGEGEKHQLTCTDCHKPGDDGKFMRRITYEEHCKQCHSLHFSADVPELTIPHRDPEKVRTAMQSAGLTSLFLEYANDHLKLTDKAQQQAFIEQQFGKLQQRGIDTTEKLLIRVFRTGDPPNVKEDQAFPACAKCHEVNFPGGNATPRITPTNSADRWLTRGPFTHAPHGHMSCTDCHRQAKTSTKTTDILMPPKTYCAECHRPLEDALDEPAMPRQGIVKRDAELTARQLTEGGVANNCQYCHPKYHSAQETAAFTQRAVKVRNPHLQ